MLLIICYLLHSMLGDLLFYDSVISLDFLIIQVQQNDYHLLLEERERKP